MYRHACLVVFLVLERNEWKEESRRIECIFGNKYNLNELAVNWKWAIQGYLTRGSPLASRPPPCSLSLQSSPSSSHVRSSVSFRLTSSLPPASPCTRTFSLFPSIRSFRDPTPLRRSKRYFRRQIPPQQRETFRTWGDASFPPPAYFSSSPRQEYTPRRSVCPFPEQTEFDRPLDASSIRHLPYTTSFASVSIFRVEWGHTVTWGQLSRMPCASVLPANRVQCVVIIVANILEGEILK